MFPVTEGPLTECLLYLVFTIVKFSIELVQASVVDKKSVMTYVMCMYQVLAHQDTQDSREEDVIDEASVAVAAGLLEDVAVHVGRSGSLGSSGGGKKSTSSSATASPLKVPPKVVTKGRTSFFISTLG